jgi:hypothetical protein
MSLRHVVKTAAACSAATLCGVAFALAAGAGPAGADLVSGNTTLSTASSTGTVTPGTPYSSGQTITVTVTPNSVLNNTNLVNNNVPGQTAGNPTGDYYIEECTDPGGTVGAIASTATGCEPATDDFTTSKTTNGAFTDSGYIVYDLPDSGTLGSAEMVGTCGEAPNYCVLGIFATNPQSSNGFSYPHLFSAPFQMDKQSDFGSGAETGINPGDGTPEVPLAIGLPLAALAVFGGWTIRNRRRHRQEQAA